MELLSGIKPAGLRGDDALAALEIRSRQAAPSAAPLPSVNTNR